MNPHEIDDTFDQGEVRERQAARPPGRGRRRRGAAPTISTISWRDIPAQLTARVDGEQRKLLLHARFQHAIDRAAGVAGLTATDDYVAEWVTASEPLDVDASDLDVDALLDDRCRVLEAAYPRERLEALVANGGLEPDPGATPRSPDPESDRP